jgi:stearoyl-CoA desaturase (delta-9 desaturase)
MTATPRPRIRLTAALGFGLVHVAALGVFAVGLSWEGVVLCLGSYYLRMFAITAGFHRYFAHRTYRMNRLWQFLMAFLGQTAAQKGVLWWAAHHRHHHRFSDQPEDIHSPVQRGFWWSHMGWILADEYEETRHESIRDFTSFPELVWLDRNQFLAPMLYAFGLWLAFSWTGLFWGFFLSTVLLWHGTFAINSVMHVFGRRVFETRDTSRNSFVMALVTMGEGWHNNHHHFQASAAQGFLWWQVDPSLYLLRLGRLLGVAKDLRPVPERVTALARERGAWHFSSRTFEKAREAFDGAQAAWDARAEQLSALWSERREAALASASQRLAELEASRLRAAAQLERLKADYASALASAAAGTRLRGQRAKALAQIRVEELRVEIERTRQSLVDALERLVEASGMSDGFPSPA